MKHMKYEVEANTQKYYSIATTSIWISILILLMASYRELPDTIPTHFAADGAADSHGDKATLLIITTIGLAVTLMMSVIPRYPQLYNIPFAIDSTKRAAAINVLNGMTRKLNLCVSLLFLLLIGGTIRIANGKWDTLPSLGLGIILALIVAILISDTAQLWKYREQK